MDSTPLLKHVSPFLQWAKDYATWEVIGGVSAFFGRNLFKKSVSAELDKAAAESSMSLTPDGWETDKRRFADSDPIRPR